MLYIAYSSAAGTPIILINGRRSEDSHCMPLPQYTISLMCMTTWELQRFNMGAGGNAAGKDGRWAWEWAARRTTVSKVCKMPFFFAGGASIWWSNRNYTVRFGEEAWSLPLYWRQALRLLPDLEPGAGLIGPVSFLMRPAALFSDQRLLPFHFPHFGATSVASTWREGVSPTL